MKITIFQNVKPHPNSKEEKNRESAKCILGVIMEIANEEELYTTITKYAWSPAIFNGRRNDSNFVSTDFMVLDIDNEATIPQINTLIDSMKLAALVAPSPSHTEEFHKFRVIFPLSQTITDKKMFDATWDYLRTKFPMIDTKCSNYSRHYFASKPYDSFWIEGDLLEPVIVKELKFDQFRYENTQMVSLENYSDKELLERLFNKKVPKKVPECVEYFLSNAHTGLPDGWIVPLNNFVFTLSAMYAINKETIEEIVQHLAPEDLDDRDIKTIENAYRDGEERRHDI